MTIYGPGWERSVTIFQWLAASLFAGVAMKATYWIYESLGRTRQMFIWSLMFVPVIGIGFLVAIPYGPVGIAAAYALVINLSLLPCFAFATRGTPVSLPDTLRVILPMAGRDQLQQSPACCFRGLTAMCSFSCFRRDWSI